MGKAGVRAATVRAEIGDLRAAVRTEADGFVARWTAAGAPADPCLDNLACYLALRRRDLRPLQRRLMALGLTSFGRAESRVIATLEAALAAASALAGETAPVAVPDEADFFAGETALTEATDGLFGPPVSRRRTRIMVTLPTEAATDDALVRDLVADGMDVARINCAHDGPADWIAMAGKVRAAAAAIDRPVRILMDVAGPKIRTGAIVEPRLKARMVAGDALRLVAHGPPRGDEPAPFSVRVSLPEMVTRLAVGHRVLYDDGKVEGRVETVDDGTAVVRILRAKTGGARLKPEKGINLPDTALGLAALTTKDERDLDTVVSVADMVGYSFVSRPEDIDLLDAALDRRPRSGAPLGLVAKIERPEAVRNLPDLIARARGRRPFGVMIARGDLAAELGFERLAEMQEEILWICEAASVPVVWATQVLEELVKTGIPSRGEMTDAAMAGRAECVMLNKGPAVTAAVELLDRLLERMDAHQFKKTPTLRALTSW